MKEALLLPKLINSERKQELTFESFLTFLELNIDLSYHSGGSFLRPREQRHASFLQLVSGAWKFGLL